MGALDSLVRIHNWILNEKRQQLTGIETLIQRMTADLRSLEEDLERERQAAAESIEGTVAFPAFIAAVLERRKRLRLSIANLERAADSAREAVQAAFEDVKKYELAHDLDRRQEVSRRARHERTVSDELGAEIFRRRQSSTEH